MMEAGHITVALAPYPQIHSTRIVDCGCMFVGRPVEDVARLVPMIFAACSKAQGLAARRALGLATGVDDLRAVYFEALREHMLRIAGDWHFGAPSEGVEKQLAAIHKLPRQMDWPAAVSQLQSLAATPNEILESTDWLETARTPASEFLRRVQAEPWTRQGEVHCAAETSALVLCEHEPVLKQLIAEQGRGLFSRLYARLVHCALLIEGLRLGVSQEEAALPVVTSRGHLHHEAQVQGGIVMSYKITAPTDVNFASDGPAAKSLASLCADCKTDVERPVRLLIEAFDPCVPYTLRLN